MRADRAEKQRPTGRYASGNRTTRDEDPIGAFFAKLAAAGHVATFERNSATLRFDIADGADGADGGNSDASEAGRTVKRWYVTVTNGDVAITHRRGPADAVVRMRHPHFEALVTGRLNAQAAYLRGLLTCEGSIAALMMFQRCLPGPPGSTGRAAPISSAAVMAERRPG